MTKVKIKEWDDMVEEFGLDGMDDIVMTIGMFYSDMKEHCGKEYEIELDKDEEFRMDGWEFSKDCYTIIVEEPPKDTINPDHYKTGGIETIDYMKAKLGKQGFEGYLAGNVLKYVSRYKEKNGLEDLNKASWYLNRLIKESE